MAKLSPERWRRIDEIFQAAADLPPEARAEYLNREAAGDAELLASVQEMLAGLSENLVERAVSGALALLNEQVEPGESIGPYLLLERIGRGGMGAVYLAVRQGEDFEQRVAVKVLRREIAGSALAARFSRERRILSALDHPYIARLVDGGTHRGAPYLVMEFIGGQPVDSYCREQGLETRGRLELFLRICEAVSHAHQRLVVHSDLKPSNILVLPNGMPKLLDFGIAKLLEEEDGEGSGPLTETGWRPMTRDYASPEQIRGERIGMASDIYSLGVVLLEMLTGERRLRKKGEAGNDAGERRTGSARRELSGDLERIVSMALREEPERRYASVDWFALDIRRYLAGQTVMARPDTLGYRTRKFVKRNGAAVALTVALLVTGAAGVFSTVREGQRAQRRFGQVRALANRVVTDFDTEARRLTGSENLRRMMVSESLNYLDSLAKEAGDDVELQQDVALAYHRIADIQGYHRIPNLGRRDLAAKYHETALEIEKRLWGRGQKNGELRRSMALGYSRLSELRSMSGDKEGAAAALEEALRLTVPEDPEVFVPVHLQQSRKHLYAGEFEESLRHNGLALNAAAQLKDPAYRMVLIYERAKTLRLSGRTEEAVAMAREGLRVVETEREKFGQDAAFRRREALLNSELGTGLGRPGALGLGRTCEAESYFGKAWALSLPDEPRRTPVLAGVGLDWLRVRAACGKDLPEEAVRKVRSLIGANRDGRAELEMALAERAWRMGKTSGARRALEAASGKGLATAALLEMRAWFEFEAGRRAAALTLLRAAREQRATALADASMNVREHLFAQGLNLAQARAWGDTEPGVQEQLEQVVARWPEYRLSPRLEAVRALAKK